MRRRAESCVWKSDESGQDVRKERGILMRLVFDNARFLKKGNRDQIFEWSAQVGINRGDDFLRLSARSMRVRVFLTFNIGNGSFS